MLNFRNFKPCHASIYHVARPHSGNLTYSYVYRTIQKRTYWRRSPRAWRFYDFFVSYKCDYYYYYHHHHYHYCTTTRGGSRISDWGGGA